ncbi:outer membrane beta-barrel protein [Carboxylicivirga linearis]|uniref:Outer membrane beta-barrel protein n=1 Tax=Carboxylicivirga linearis TaxID=1628157 RepID=A0ABS5JUL9_9BACT|nr:outer membrane beta-barrel protein [Carboxylicivirga linearis]MBS2098569.1 outer membrane beta-barrel protein [Carboxylicivirga linearis]
MIKRILTLAVVLTLFISTQAQDKSMGLRIGYQSSYMMVDNSKVGSSGNSFYVNAYRDNKLLPFLFFHSGLQYSQSESTIESHDYKINYLGAPLAMKVKVGPIYALGGASFNVKLNEKNNPFESSSSWYDTNAFVGAGFKLLFMTIDTRYMWGLTDVNQGIHNNSFQVGLGLRF